MNKNGYGEFSLDVYLKRIFPVINNVRNKRNNNLDLSSLLCYYCSPNETNNSIRFYPSALTILLYKSIEPNSEVNEFIINVAAAVELFHNHSLAHDDVFDNHSIRRNRETILKKSSSNSSILVGNAMIGECLNLISGLPNNILHDLLQYFSRAIIDLNLGQYMDEFLVWKKINNDNLYSHWWEASLKKLAVGIFGAQVSGIMHSRLDLMDNLTKFEENMSLISQILNDTGDVFRFAGFYRMERTSRKPLEESEIKYTYPLIWLAKVKEVPIDKLNLNHDDLMNDLRASNYLNHVEEEVERLRALAVHRVHSMDLPSSMYSDILFDYIEGPKLPRILIE